MYYLFVSCCLLENIKQTSTRCIPSVRVRCHLLASVSQPFRVLCSLLVRCHLLVWCSLLVRCCLLLWWSLLAWWCLLVRCCLLVPDAPEDAVKAAQSMMNALAKFNLSQDEAQDEPVRMGIGFSTGAAMLGVDWGGREHYVAGLISDVANTSARVEGLNRIYGSRILLSAASTAQAVENNLKLRKLDKGPSQRKNSTNWNLRDYWVGIC